MAKAQSEEQGALAAAIEAGTAQPPPITQPNVGAAESIDKGRYHVRTAYRADTFVIDDATVITGEGTKQGDAIDPKGVSATQAKELLAAANANGVQIVVAPVEEG